VVEDFFTFSGEVFADMVHWVVTAGRGGMFVRTNVKSWADANGRLIRERVKSG
jgi:hypothetical protein